MKRPADTRQVLFFGVPALRIEAEKRTEIIFPEP